MLCFNGICVKLTISILLLISIYGRSAAAAETPELPHECKLIKLGSEILNIQQLKKENPALIGRAAVTRSPFKSLEGDSMFGPGYYLDLFDRESRTLIKHALVVRKSKIECPQDQRSSPHGPIHRELFEFWLTPEDESKYKQTRNALFELDMVMSHEPYWSKVLKPERLKNITKKSSAPPGSGAD